MYLFLVLGLPLAFLLLVMSEYPAEELAAAKQAFLRGLLVFIPAWLVARLLGAIVPQSYGSFLSAFHEWAGRILPYSALPAFGYLVFYKADERLPPGAAPRRLTAFYAGALAPAGLFDALFLWGDPEPYGLFILPLLLAAICVAMPKVAAYVHMSYGFELAKTIAAAAAATLAASLCPFLFRIQLWPLALLLAAAAAFGAYRFAYDELLARPPTVFE